MELRVAVSRQPLDRRLVRFRSKNFRASRIPRAVQIIRWSRGVVSLRQHVYVLQHRARLLGRRLVGINFGLQRRDRTGIVLLANVIVGNSTLERRLGRILQRLEVRIAHRRRLGGRQAGGRVTCGLIQRRALGRRIRNRIGVSAAIVNLERQRPQVVRIDHQKLVSRRQR